MNELIKSSLKLINEQLICNIFLIEAKIPVMYFDRGITEIVGKDVVSFGLFDLKLYITESDYDNKKYTKVKFKFPSKLTLKPYKIEKSTDEYTLLFQKDDVFMNATVIEQDASVSVHFLDLILQGFIPRSITYVELIDYWNDCNAINKVNLKANNTILELIISELSRNPDNLDEPFRLALKKGMKMNDYEMIKLVDLPRRTSSFAGVSSAYSKKGVTSAVSRKKQNDKTGKKEEDTVLERALK